MKESTDVKQLTHVAVLPEAQFLVYTVSQFSTLDSCMAFCLQWFLFKMLW